MLSFTVDDESAVIEFLLDGEVTKAELDKAFEAIDAAIAHHGKVNAVAVVRAFDGMELAAWWRDMSWGIRHLFSVPKRAVVTDVPWIRAASHLAGIFPPIETRVFALDEVEAARAWVREAPPEEKS